MMQKNMRGERMMKRLLTVVISLILVLSIAACEPTPQKAVVAQKNQETMLGQAEKETADAAESEKPTASAGSLSAQYGIPGTYAYETQGADGRLTIHVDAQVVVPDVSAMSIYRVRKAAFSQQTVDAFFDALCGDAQMVINSGQRTKEQLEDQIINVKKRMADVKDNPDELKIAKDALASLERLLETAPETVEEQRADGTLQQMSETIPKLDLAVEGGGSEPVKSEPPETVYYTGLDAYEPDENGTDGRGRTFNVQNRESSSVIFYTDFRNSAGGINFGSSPSLPILKDADVDEDMTTTVGMKPSDAGKMVQELLDKTNSGMVVDSVYLQDDEQKGNYDGIVRDAERYAYKIYCVRAVDGIPCSNVIGGSKPVTGDMTAPFWLYEELVFLVNSEGIVSMEWLEPIKVTETVNEDAQLKPFSQIKEIFETMMRIQYEPQAEYVELNFEINRVTLSLHRIVEQNDNDTGLLVPAWNFYGKLTNKTSDGQFEELGGSFMTINAVDGSVIDTQKGY